MELRHLLELKTSSKSCRLPGIERLTDDAFSACASSVVRCYYSVKAYPSQESVYYLAMMVRWTFLEMASGTLSACLPVSPNFFSHLKKSKVWFGLESSLRSFFHSKTATISNPVTHMRVNDIKASRLPDRSRSFGIGFARQNSLSDDIELAMTSKGGSKGQNTRDKQMMESSSNLHQV